MAHLDVGHDQDDRPVTADPNERVGLEASRAGCVRFAASERQKFIEKNALPIYDGSQEYCLWLGCMGSYDPQGREIVLALAIGWMVLGYRVLQRLSEAPREERVALNEAAL